MAAPEVDAVPVIVTASHEADARPVNLRSIRHQVISTGPAQATISPYPAQPVADDRDTAAGGFYRLYLLSQILA